MTYLEMCHYIVAKEGFNWNQFVSSVECRKEEFRETRQICFYFGWKYFKSLSYSKMGQVFHKNHATVIHSIKVIERNLRVEGDFKRKMKAYDKKITETLSTYRLKEDDESEKIMEKLLTSLEQMRIISEAYCRITGKKIV